MSDNNKHLSEILITLSILTLGTIWIIIGIFKLLSIIFNFFIKLFNKNETVNKKEIVYKTKYDNYFKPQIIERGIEYFNEGKVIEYKKENNILTGTVKGTENYKVTCTLEYDDLYEYTCTCPYIEKYKSPCKHVYAILLKYVNESVTTKKQYNFNKETTKKEKNYNQEIKELYKELRELEEQNKKEKQEKSNKKFNAIKEIYGLTNDQVEEVKKGNYDPWNFDEEDLEEDDYYYDDPD